MIDFAKIEGASKAHEPYEWAFVPGLYNAHDAHELAASYPHDHYKTLKSTSGNRSYFYDARSFIGQGADVASYPNELSPAWKQLAEDLMSPTYRQAMSRLVGRDWWAAIYREWKLRPTCSITDAAPGWTRTSI